VRHDWRLQVPILEVGDDKLIESSVCAEYVAEAFAQVGISLYITINQAIIKADTHLALGCAEWRATHPRRPLAQGEDASAVGAL
jgi:glutathione S-transferase